MYFKHPELLYALFLLVIPVLVHLFQLRKFRTTTFTNVKFLKKAVLQTRKSSRLKKFLILCTRLLLLASVIFAFAQPYFPPASGEIKEVETVIWLDNSYSMQARGQNGILLRRSIQDLLENLPKDAQVTLFTNEQEFRNVSSNTLRERLQALDFSATQLPWRAIAFKAQNFFGNSREAQKNFIAISDFQHLDDSVALIGENVTSYLVQLEPENSLNISVDSVFTSSRSLDETELGVEISASGALQEEVSVGLYNEDRLLARKTIPLNEELKGSTTFSFASEAIPFGSIRVEDSGLQFDNRLYFSINETPPVKVVVIGDSEAEYLQRIYKEPEFLLHIFPENNIDYNLLSQANLVILNEPQKVPFSLITTLQQLLKEGVFLIVVPAPDGDLEDYNNLLRNLDLPTFGTGFKQEKLITNITFEHPLYQSVFNERVTNFEYPKVQSSFSLTGAAPGILKYPNGQPFLFEKNNVFVFTAALRRENSNFKSAPLIVPTFYNIGNLAISPDRLYHLLGNTQKISIQANLQKDEILKLSSSETTFIPQQQSFQNKVDLVLDELPKQEGHYRVLQDSVVLRALSFNIDRRESIPVQNKIREQDGISVQSSIPQVFQDIKSAGEVHTLWKWFIILALFFLLTEMLILKFLK
ncbi:hypothetical protein HC174_07030 [Salinimicrobium sp. CDJ15-81-2]|nr:hypothetical protein [Salinimicrobium nanhaiense]